MKAKTKTTIHAVIFMTFIFSTLISSSAVAQKKLPVIRIGTYDSRVVTFAWSRTDQLRQHLLKINQMSDSARKANDSSLLKDASVQAMSFQHLLHQMVFSKGSTAWIMELIKDKLRELAKKSGVSIIVSKWELNFNDPSFEVVDLTSQVAALFQPKENIDKMAEEISKATPVPMEEMGIETEMLDGYCSMYSKK
jgi:hypothetical protein